MPVTFDEEHYSAVNVVVHSALFDFKYNSVPLSESEKEDVVSIVETGQGKSSHRPHRGPSLTPAELFFALPPGGKLDPKRIARAYDNHIGLMASMHEALRTRILRTRKDFPFETVGLGPIIVNVHSAEKDPGIDCEAANVARSQRCRRVGREHDCRRCQKRRGGEGGYVSEVFLPICG